MCATDLCNKDDGSSLGATSCTVHLIISGLNFLLMCLKYFVY